jgi:hypothetical protein
MARDLIHQLIRQALETDGWLITQDPYPIKIGGVVEALNEPWFFKYLFKPIFLNKMYDDMKVMEDIINCIQNDAFSRRMVGVSY